MSRLKLGILRDENFQVGNRTLKMIKIGADGFTLEVKGTAADGRFEIDKYGADIFPGVRISASKSEFYTPPGTVRGILRAVVVIDAPPEVVIHRFKGPERFAA